jgi:hypothetical protein
MVKIAKNCSIQKYPAAWQVFTNKQNNIKILSKIQKQSYNVEIFHQKIILPNFLFFGTIDS